MAESLCTEWALAAWHHCPLASTWPVCCLAQLRSCCILSTISASPSPALSFQILPWRRQEMREQVSK